MEKVAVNGSDPRAFAEASSRVYGKPSILRRSHAGFIPNSAALPLIWKARRVHKSANPFPGILNFQAIIPPHKYIRSYATPDTMGIP